MICTLNWGACWVYELHFLHSRREIGYKAAFVAWGLSILVQLVPSYPTQMSSHLSILSITIAARGSCFHVQTFHPFRHSFASHRGFGVSYPSLGLSNEKFLLVLHPPKNENKTKSNRSMVGKCAWLHLLSQDSVIISFTFSCTKVKNVENMVGICCAFALATTASNYDKTRRAPHFAGLLNLFINLGTERCNVCCEEQQVRKQYNTQMAWGLSEGSSA